MVERIRIVYGEEKRVDAPEGLDMFCLNCRDRCLGRQRGVVCDFRRQSG